MEGRIQFWTFEGCYSQKGLRKRQMFGQDNFFYELAIKMLRTVTEHNEMQEPKAEGQRSNCADVKVWVSFLP